MNMRGSRNGMQSWMQRLRAKLLVVGAVLLLPSLIALGGCGSLPKQYIPNQVDIGEIPDSIKKCAIRNRVTLPKGGWSDAQMVSIISRLRAREIYLEGCHNDAIKYFEGIRTGLRRS